MTMPVSPAQRQRNWDADEPERQAAEEQLPGEVTRIKRLVRDRDGHRCTKCGMSEEEHLRVWGRKQAVHRIKPQSRYTLEGCVLLCHECHSNTPDHKEMVRQRGLKLSDTARRKREGRERAVIYLEVDPSLKEDMRLLAQEHYRSIPGECITALKEYAERHGKGGDQ